MGRAAKRQPLYDQLVDLLQSKIENEMSPGDVLPSERELCETYGLSRTTVRLALAEPETQGYVVRKHGKGTFVADTSREATNLMGTYSFTEQMRKMGRVPKTTILDFELRGAPKHAASFLDVRIGEPVIRIKRLRWANDVPMMVETTYLPANEFVGLTQEELSTTPLYDLMEKTYHQTIRAAEEEFCASICRPEEAELLQIPEGAAVLRLYRTTYNDRNTAIEYTRSVARADQFRYKISHYRG